MRAHLYRAIQDAKGNLIINATVRLLDPDSGTPISDTLYADKSTGSTLTNPFTIGNGYVDVYFDTPRRVNIGVTVGGNPEFFFNGIDIDYAPDAANFSDQVASSLNSEAARSAIEAIVADYLATNSFFPSFYIGSGDPLPTNAPDGASLDILVANTAPSLVVSSLMAEAINGATSVTSSATPPALGAGAVVIAAVSTRTSGTAITSTSPSPLPSSFTGLGLTWTRITLPTGAILSGGCSLALYIGKGTGTSAKPVMAFTSAPTTVHLRLTNLANASGTVLQANSAAVAANNATPTVSLPNGVGAGSVTLSVIVQNNGPNDQTPGTGYTELSTALNSTALRTSSAYSQPPRQAASWSTPISPAGYQKLVAIVEVS